MNLNSYYWYFQSVIPERICDDIVRQGKSLSDQMAVTGSFGGKKLNNKQIKVQVGILIGIILKLVNLQNTRKVNTMIGIVIVGKNLTLVKIHKTLFTVK